MAKNNTSRRRVGWGIAALAVAIIVGVGVGVFARLLHPAQGERTRRSGPMGFLESLNDMRQVAIEPKEGFPGHDRLTILCMGIDDNWTNKDEVYTKGSRTDTLFLMSLDLVSHKIAILSIPRDSYVHIAGTDYSSKINSAYATGGPQRALATVSDLTGVRVDHYLVLNIDATKKMVAALGGVDVNVEHPMHYHDKWGHLSIDLEPGFQHLDADQAVGFARYRHGDKGAKSTVEDGDDRRMYRQHVLLQAMVKKAKSFANVAQAPHLVDAAMSTIATDLTRTQIFDLAAIFKGVQPNDIQTASLTGSDFIAPNGAWCYKLDMPRAHSYADWLIEGDAAAARRLVPVVVENDTGVTGLAARAATLLKAQGYTDVHVANGPRGAAPPIRTRIVDNGVVDPSASADIAGVLGLTDAETTRRVASPASSDAPPAVLRVSLGGDYAQVASPTEAGMSG